MADDHDADADEQQDQRAAERRGPSRVAGRRRAARSECRRATARSASAAGSPSPARARLRGRRRRHRPVDGSAGAQRQDVGDRAAIAPTPRRRRPAQRHRQAEQRRRPQDASRMAPPRSAPAKTARGHGWPKSPARARWLPFAGRTPPAAERPNQRRQHRERRGRRSAEAGDQTRNRRDPRGSGQPPSRNERHQPIRRPRAFGEAGNESGGDDHQPGRPDRLGKSDAERLADEAAGSPAAKPNADSRRA